MSGIESLQMVSRTPVRKRRYWTPTYESSSDFQMLWWRDKYESEPPIEDHWVSFVLGNREVARCKYVMTGARADPVLGDPPHGQLDILAFEVAVPMRRKGIGRVAIQAIRDQNPLPRLTALNDGVESRKVLGRHRLDQARACSRHLERRRTSDLLRAMRPGGTGTMRRGKIFARGCGTRFRLPAQHVPRHILIVWR